MLGAGAVGARQADGGMQSAARPQQRHATGRLVAQLVPSQSFAARGLPRSLRTWSGGGASGAAGGASADDGSLYRLYHVRALLRRREGVAIPPSCERRMKANARCRRGRHGRGLDARRRGRLLLLRRSAAACVRGAARLLAVLRRAQHITPLLCGAAVPLGRRWGAGATWRLNPAPGAQRINNARLARWPRLQPSS